LGNNLLFKKKKKKKRGLKNFFAPLLFVFVVYVLRESGDDALIIYIHTFGSGDTR